MNIQQIANTKAAGDTATERGHMNAAIALAQIGQPNVLAISGGRTYTTENAIILPVSSGYHVVVSLDENDTYTVRRVFVRGGKASVKGEWSNIYCDMVGEVAYGASCYR